MIPVAKATHMGFLYDWQYNGAAPFQEILEWCEEHIPNQYGYNGFKTIYFDNSGAYAYFLLRWA